MSNSIQFDNNMLSGQQSSNMFTQNNNIQPTQFFNQPSNQPSNLPTNLPTNLPSNLPTNLPSNLPSNLPTNLPTNLPADSFSSQQSNQMMSFDPALLNGTSLDDTPGLNSNFKQTQSVGMNTKNPKLIKSVAREIINGLKDNNMSVYDNSSINSYKGGKSTNYECDDDDDKDDDDDNENNSRSSNRSNKSKSKSKSKSKNKVKNVVESIEDFIIDGETKGTKSYSEYAGWFFDECFNYKDFLVLFILYFVLSQEMIKDFFAKYFSSLNPDYEGKICVQGVIIYGLILTVLFMVIKKFF